MVTATPVQRRESGSCVLVAPPTGDEGLIKTILNELLLKMN